MSKKDYLKNRIKQPKILTRIQLSAKKAGLETMTEEEIEAEIREYQQSKKRNK